jgi:sodium/potassium-transporting ATPase subunit alpha
LTVKGAPNVLISQYAAYIDRDRDRKSLNPIASTSIGRIKDKWSSQGKHVILLAHKVVRTRDICFKPTSTHFKNKLIKHAKSGLTLVGIVGIIDPPYDDIPFIIRTLRGAGIRVMMVRTIRYVIRVIGILID